MATHAKLWLGPDDATYAMFTELVLSAGTVHISSKGLTEAQATAIATLWNTANGGAAIPTTAVTDNIDTETDAVYAALIA